MKTKEEQIKEIISNFDWVRVHKVFIALKWEYYKVNGIPTIGDLINAATDCLNAVASGGTNYCDSGGFKATLENGLMGLDFIVEDYFVEAE